MHEHLAIGALQRRAGDHGLLSGLADPFDLIGDSLQPGPAIFVGERLTGAHLRDVARGVKLVAILVAPAEALRQFFPNGALARAGHAHHDQRARHLAWFIAHENSPEAPPDPPARPSRRWNAHDSQGGSRPRARASRSHACPSQRPRTAFHGRSRAPARSAAPAARAVRYGLWARRPPRVRSLRWRDSREIAMRYGRPGRRPSTRHRTTAGRDRDSRHHRTIAAHSGSGVPPPGDQSYRSESGGCWKPARSDPERSAAPCPYC